MADIGAIRTIFGYPDSLYNCSKRTAAEWASRGTQWPALGMLLVIMGTFYLCLYALCANAIIKCGLTSHSCYRIMSILIVADVLNVISASWFNAYMAITGAVFCTHPLWSYLNGMFTISVWNFACYHYVLLAINRLCVITNFKKLNWLFERCGGYVLWVVPAVLYSINNGVLHKPFCFNSRVFAVIQFPFIEDPETEAILYENPTHAWNNNGTGILLIIIYAFISCFVICKKNFRVSKDEMKLLLQSVLITIPTFFGTVVYVWVQMFPDSLLLSLLGYIGWQSCAGIGSIVYICLNQSIRSFYFKETLPKNETITENERGGTYSMKSAGNRVQSVGQ